MSMSRAFSALRTMRLYLRSAAYRTYLRLAHPGVKCHPSVRFARGVTIRAFDGGTIEFGEGTAVLEFAQVQAEGGRIVFGRNCLVGRSAVIIGVELIEIGDGTLTAEHVTIRDQDHNHEGLGRLEEQGHSSAPIRIGNDVWLGAKVTVTRGVIIAPHCVVGANAVVTRDLPERGVYAGIPARPLSRVAKPSR